MFKLVIFDLDGTLVDTATEIAIAVNCALAECGLPQVDEAKVRSWIGQGTRELMRQAFSCASGEAQNASARPEFDSAMRAFEWHYLVRSGCHGALFPHVVESLHKLREVGIATALLTNKESRFTAPVLHAHNLWECLDAVVCGDTLAAKKPDPLTVQHCLARFKASPERTLLVGDSEIDVMTARNAGIPVWAVPYGYNHGKPISEAKADRIIPDIRSVIPQT